MPKLISLNVERSKHLHRNIPFLQKERPDILCLQEVFEDDQERFARELEMPYYIWLKDAYIDAEKSGAGKPGYSGIAIYSRTPFSDTGSEYYYVPEGGISLEKGSAPFVDTNAQVVVWASLSYEGVAYQIASTLFTCTAAGVFDENQKHDFQELKKILDRLGAHILAGDLNSPRGRGSWEQFVEYYGEDNIPTDVISTIDPELHRRKGLELVVDGIFATPPYTVGDVRVVSGLSDHKGLVAQIEKKKTLE